MADPWQECMDYAVTLARQAGEMAREALKNEMNIMIKSLPVDLVTATDQKVEKMLISSIKEKYPSHSFTGEESVAAGEKSILTDSPTWIIDPIDGTTNFVHGFPFVAVSIEWLKCLFHCFKIFCVLRMYFGKNMKAVDETGITSTEIVN
uniref:Lithium-sensitive myo-inositol monophosphatase A1 n=1 Tax=Phocoena sinus TaxID=42100 RepID=A0A8C9C9Y8_PHOSS